jgi:(p)ppGpp synthase/HD superfamily hydrolase
MSKYRIFENQKILDKYQEFESLVENHYNGGDFLLQKAYKFSCEAHRSQKRKATGDPYVIHCMDTACLLMEGHSPLAVVIAGLLHDTVEDAKYTGVTEQIIRNEFGNYIANLVMDVTEKDKTKTWQARKDEAIEHIKYSGRNVKLLKCADKLSNISDMTETQEILGDRMWSMGFKGTKDGHKKNFQKIASALEEISETGIYKKYAAELDKFLKS